jgi:anti-anti-sigma factor
VGVSDTTPPPGDDDTFAVDVEHEAGAALALLRLAGELDTATVGELSAVLERVVADGATELRIDMAAVPFMDSTGLTALIIAQGRLEGRGVVTVESASSAVRRTFEVAGLDVVFGTA